MKDIPYKIYLEETEMPKTWYNIKADMKEQHDPFLHPGRLDACTREDLLPVFCGDLVDMELNLSLIHIYRLLPLHLRRQKALAERLRLKTIAGGTPYGESNQSPLGAADPFCPLRGGFCCAGGIMEPAL